MPSFPARSSGIMTTIRKQLGLMPCRYEHDAQFTDKRTYITYPNTVMKTILLVTQSTERRNYKYRLVKTFFLWAMGESRFILRIVGLFACRMNYDGVFPAPVGTQPMTFYYACGTLAT